MSIISVFQDEKNSGDWLHKYMNVCNSTGPYLKMVHVVNFTLCVFYHNFKWEKKTGMNPFFNFFIMYEPIFERHL